MCRGGPGDVFAVISPETREGKSQGAGPHPSCLFKETFASQIASPGARRATPSPEIFQFFWAACGRGWEPPVLATEGLAVLLLFSNFWVILLWASEGASP